MSANPANPIAHRVAHELQLSRRGVTAALALLDEGATVPFLARYRKEATGGLDEVQLRDIQERHAYVKDLEARRATILETIDEQGKLTPELRTALQRADTKAALEDLYLPYKKKRRTRATKARERGLEPLADRLRAQPPEGAPFAEAATYVNPALDVPDPEAALAGARDIIAEEVAEHADVRALVRAQMTRNGILISRLAKKKDAKKRTKFEAYYDFQEPVASVPSHRYLAMRRGENEGVLKVGIAVDTERVLGQILRLIGYDRASPWGEQLQLTVADSCKRLLFGSIETEVRSELKVKSDLDAVQVFARNLRNLLLTPAFGPRSVIGIDPGIRTGCKVVTIESTGRFVETATIFPQTADPAKAAEALLALVRKHQPDAIAVGNGTAGRETEAFVRDALANGDLGDTAPIVVLVNEAGASVYSASDTARSEFPDLDLTVRGAISIGRRLQDPLAELVKIDPKSIGVGQYQHDVHQPMLKRKLDEVIESCVNSVGVDLDTASAPLLGYVAGIGPKLAKRIVEHREKKGRITSRAALLDVSGLGPRAFEQCAGFLRIKNGQHPLDASAVHPERYALVESMAGDLTVELQTLVGSPDQAARIDVKRYVGDGVGEPTLRDIIAELGRPGRDPRQRFEPPKFREDVRTMDDLEPGMLLDGVVTNVTHFGAFVDIGVKQDGLVHISQLADRFVKDAHAVVQVGTKVKVKVMAIDAQRKRISLSRRLDAKVAPKASAQSAGNEPTGEKPDGTGGRKRRRRRRGPRSKPKE